MKYYALETFDCMGKKTRFIDNISTLTIARRIARHCHRDPAHAVVHILKELGRPKDHEYGAQWEVLEIIK